MRRCGLFLLLVLAFVAPAFAAGLDPEGLYPEAQPGWVRHVLHLPAASREQEVDLRVELVAGVMQRRDSRNQARSGAALAERTLPGWGYAYYEVQASELTIETRMAVVPGDEQVRFVAGEPMMVRYNSRLPLIVYAPKEYRVRTRLWRAEPWQEVP